MKLILLNPDTNETVATSPTVMSANIETCPRHVQLVLDFHGMTQEQFTKMATMVANTF